MLELLMSLLENPHLQLGLFAYVVVYGIALGVEKLHHAFDNSLQIKKLHQSPLGRILDSLWITSIVLLIVAHY